MDKGNKKKKDKPEPTNKVTHEPKEAARDKVKKILKCSVAIQSDSVTYIEFQDFKFGHHAPVRIIRCYRIYIEFRAHVIVSILSEGDDGK